MTAIIDIANLDKKFTLAGTAIEIIENVSLSLRANTLIAIIGTSGSGKSTFLNLLSGLDKPDHGEITIAGKTITTMGEHQLAKFRSKSIGFIFQQPQLIGELTVLENILLPSQIARFPKEKAEAHAQTLLLKTGLKKREHHLIGELSGGEMQRVVIARALINYPKIILADEPTGNLDKKNALEVFNILHSLALAKRVTIVMVTHDLQLAKKADVTYEIRNKNLNKVLIRARRT